MFVQLDQECVFSISESGLIEEMQTARKRVSEFSRQNEAVLQMFDELTTAFQLEMPKESLLKLLEGIQFETKKHENQNRKDVAQTPYAIHPMGVCLSLWQEGSVRDLDTLLAALLHDTLEDTETTKEEISNHFGIRVADIVEELTNPKGLTSEESKKWQIEHAPTLSFEAKLVKLADRLYNLRDLVHVTWNQEKIQSYYLWGEKLLEALKGTNPSLEALIQAEIDLHQ